MKKILRPFKEAMHNSYEKMTFLKAPAGRSKKIRRYDHIDLTKEFEFRKAQRDKLKQEAIEDLYERHDKKALSIKDIIEVHKYDNQELS